MSEKPNLSRVEQPEIIKEKEFKDRTGTIFSCNPFDGRVGDINNGVIEDYKGRKYNFYVGNYNGDFKPEKKDNEHSFPGEDKYPKPGDKVAFSLYYNDDGSQFIDWHYRSQQ